MELASKLKTTLSENPIFWCKMAKLWASLMFHIHNTPSVNQFHLVRNVYFMHLGELLGFVCELGNKLRSALTKNPYSRSS